MADYHFVYKDVEGATTQWDDIQRRLGNLPPKPEPLKPPPFAPKVDADEQPKSKEWIDAREPEELEELEDDLDRWTTTASSSSTGSPLSSDSIHLWVLIADP